MSDGSNDSLGQKTSSLSHIEVLQRDDIRISPEYQHEQAVAIYDILDQNLFILLGHQGPFHLYLSTDMRHVHFDVRAEDGTRLNGFIMALGPLRRIMRDYFQICDTYYEAIRTKSPTQIQAIDMGRRAAHDEGATLLSERLGGFLETDEMTARRLFTLICVMTRR